MKILIDTNIILDWLQQRSPFYEQAHAVMETCVFESVQGFISAHSLCDIFYILRKDFPVKDRLDLIKMLSIRFNIISENQKDFILVADAPTTKDLEDSLQIRCAKKCTLDYIVTRNLKDFIHSEIEAIEPKTFLESLKSE